MVSLFKEKSAASFFWLILLSMGLHIQFIYKPPFIAETTNEGLISSAFNVLKTVPSVFLFIIYQAIILLQAFMLNYILNEARMFTKPVYTTALAFILLTALLPEWSNISAMLMVNFIVIIIINYVALLYNNQKPKALIYNMGLITGLGVLLYYPLLPLTVIIFFALISIRPFRITELLILLSGIITPFYFYACYLFFNDKLSLILAIKDVFEWHVIKPENLILAVITFTACGLAILYGVYLTYTNSNRMVVQVRKVWLILFFMLMLFVPVIFFIKNSWPYILLILAVPAAAFTSYGFISPKKNIIPAIFFWLLVGITFYNNWALIYK